VKIAIMTIFNSENNYGQILQCYALQRYLTDLGHEVYCIRYNSENDYTKTPILLKLKKAINIINTTKYIYLLVKNSFFENEERKYDRCFEEFRQKYIKQSDIIYNTYNDLVNDPPVADIYMAGSDQIWNFTSLPVYKTKNQIKAFFLQFGDKRIRRFSYATSFGVNYIKKEHHDKIASYLKNFEYVSVREKSGVDICKECGREDAEWVSDPTLLLDAETYRSLYRNENIRRPDKKYVLLYYLGHKTAFKIKILFEWAHKRNLEVIYINANIQYDKYDKFYATIPEWLYLIDNAEYVITNSFHGTIFSLLFEKRFGVIPLTGRYSGMNERLYSLFEYLNILPPIISDDFDGILTDSLQNCIEVKNSLENYL
jgi:hypothetical protein